MPSAQPMPPRKSKTLIQNSTAQVENGVQLVHGTGETLVEIGSLIKTINDHMDAIADYSRDQSSGLRDIAGRRVDALDATTQHKRAGVRRAKRGERAGWLNRPRHSGR